MTDAPEIAPPQKAIQRSHKCRSRHVDPVRVARAIATALFCLAALCVVILIVGIWASVRQAPPWVSLRTLVFFSVYFAALPLALAVIFCAIGRYVRAKATRRN
jgi:hypothetical protein